MEKRYGYIRVSSRDQNPDRQYLALENAEVNRKNIFIDKISGHDFSRPSYRKMIRKLKKGDVLVVKSIDRLGRNYGEILEQWRYLTKEIGVDIEVLDMPLLNTDLHRENLIGVFISDLVLQILAYVAETERDFIRQRQKESRSQRQMGFGLDAGRTNFLKNLICILRCGKREKSPSEKQQRFWKSVRLLFIADVRS